jgi:threonine/homoserine/homoserine lactone efflux protein
MHACIHTYIYKDIVKRYKVRTQTVHNHLHPLFLVTFFGAGPQRINDHGPFWTIICCFLLLLLLMMMMMVVVY